MKIALACDHGGFTLKNAIKERLISLKHEVVDFGTNTADSCDYPDFVRPAAEAVANGSCEKGIVFCTTGIGASMVANKVKGVRCALCMNPDMAEMTRRHNNANMIAMGQKYVDEKTAFEIVDKFLTMEFEGGKHARRVGKIENN